MNRKLERKKLMDELTQKDIHEAVVTILVDKGRDYFTMDRVAAGAGIAKGTLYLHHDSKEALLNSTVDYCFKPLDRIIEEIIGTFCESGVQKVGPCHCSGDDARRFFYEAYKDDYISMGVGQEIEVS